MTIIAIGQLFSSKLLRKGLSFVIATVVLQLLWFAALIAVVSQSENLSQSERHQTDLLQHLNRCCLAACSIGHSMMNLLVAPGSASTSAFDESVNKYSTELKACVQLTTDPEDVADTKKIFGPVEADVPELRRSLEHEGTSSFELFENMAHLRPQLQRAGSAMFQQMDVIEKKRRQLEVIRTRQTELAQLVTVVVDVGFGVTLILVVVAVFIFLIGMTSRLSLLVENARRLPKRLPLNQTVEGDDELSYLDKVLHDVASDLDKAYEHRKRLMELVANDLRSPLTSCQEVLASRLALEKETLAPKAAQRLTSVAGNLQRIIGLVNDLLTVDQLELGQMELTRAYFRCDDLARDAIQSLSGLAGRKKIQLLNKADSESVFVDRDRILQVLVNYLSNAIKFAPADSTIEISTKRQNGTVVMSVKDEGPGLSLSDQGKLFQKYSQTTEGKREHGFGLGLAICRLIVESHGGAVGVESEPGKGARFWFSVEAERSAGILKET